MADLCHTSVSRHAAINIIRAAAHFSARENHLEGKLLHNYIALCQYPDIVISHEALYDLSIILKDVTTKSAEEDFFPEVMLRIIY